MRRRPASPVPVAAAHACPTPSSVPPDDDCGEYCTVFGSSPTQESGCATAYPGCLGAHAFEVRRFGRGLSPGGARAGFGAGSTGCCFGGSTGGSCAAWISWCARYSVGLEGFALIVFVTAFISPSSTEVVITAGILYDRPRALNAVEVLLSSEMLRGSTARLLSPYETTY